MAGLPRLSLLAVPLASYDSHFGVLQLKKELQTKARQLDNAENLIGKFKQEAEDAKKEAAELSKVGGQAALSPPAWRWLLSCFY